METQLEPRKGSWKKRVAIFVLALLVLVSISLVYDMFGRVRLSRAIKAAEDLGGPVTLEQLMAARKTYPDDKNGANVILGIKDRLETIAKDERFNIVPFLGQQSKTPALGHRLSAVVDRQVRGLLDNSQKELTALDTLKQYEGGRLPMVIDPCPINNLLPNLAPLRTACKLKSVQVLDRAMRGDTTHLVDDVTVMLRIGDLLADEPMLISSLVHIACHKLTLYTIEQACGLAPLTPPQLLKLQNMLSRLDAGPRPIVCGVRGERAFFIGTLDYLRKTGDYISLGMLGVEPPRGKGTFSLATKFPGIRGFLMFDEAVGIGHYNHMVAAIEQSQDFEKVQAIDNDASKLSATAVVTRIMVPSLARAVALDMMLTAETRAAQVGLAAKRFRIDTGSLPKRLDQLVPKYIEKIPADPFKPDQPLKYAVKSDRVVIYSISDDGVDNGGDVKHGDRSMTETDCGFILLLPAARNLPPLPTTTTSAPAK